MSDDILDLSGKGLHRIELDRTASVRVLNLSNNRILKINNLQEHKSLEELLLSNNRIVKMEGLMLPKLRVLKLSRNNLTRVEGIEQLHFLEYLDVSHNNLKTTDGVAANTRLIHLDLSYNSIEVIGDLHALTTLRVLHLGHNELMTFDDAANLPRSLMRLGLESNKLQGLSFQALADFTELRDLSIRNNAFFSETPVLDILPLVAYLLPSVRLVDGKAITTRQREAARILFSKDEYSALLAPQHHRDLALFLANREGNSLTDLFSPKDHLSSGNLQYDSSVYQDEVFRLGMELKIVQTEVKHLRVEVAQYKATTSDDVLVQHRMELSQLYNALQTEISHRQAQEGAIRLLWEEVKRLRETQTLRHAQQCHLAATVIQRHWKGYWTRKLYAVVHCNYKKHCEHLSKQATTIQRIWRGYHKRKLYKTVVKIAVIQMCIRGWIARRSYSASLRSLSRIKAVEAEIGTLVPRIKEAEAEIASLKLLYNQLHTLLDKHNLV